MNGNWDTEFLGILTEVLPTSPQIEITPDLDLRRAGLDSFATVDLFVKLEEHYGITFTEENLAPITFSTPASLWQVVKELREHATRDNRG